MKKKAIIALLSALVLTVVASVSLILTVRQKASADSEIVTIPVRYLNIEDSYKLYGFTQEGEDWIKNRKCNLVIPGYVTFLCVEAFKDCSSLVSVKLSSNLTSINERVFSGCTNLTDVIIPEGITTIGRDAFSGCSSLTNLSLPNSLGYLWEGAFSGCSSLTNITLENVVWCQSRIFKDCSSLISVVTPFVTSSMFYGCINLKDVLISEDVTNIGLKAFMNCSSLTSITLPASVTSVGSDAFSNCSALTEIIVRNSDLMTNENLQPYADKLYYGADQNIVTFNTVGGTAVSEQVIDFGEQAEKPNTEKEGYHVSDWYLDAEYTKPFTFNTPVNYNIELYAKWEINQYTVTFDGNNGNAMTSQIVDYNTTVTKPTNPTRTGYTFKRWLLNGSEYDFNTPITDDITLTADWDINTYTVTFDSNGGSLVDSQTLYYSANAQEPNAPVCAGYTFMGWYLNDRLYNFRNPVTESITLQAKWGHTVTFDSDGGYEVDPQVVIDGGNAYYRWTDKPYYNFIGWYLGDTEYDFGTPVTEDITLKAHWEIYQWEVIFDSNGGTAVATQYIDHGSKVVEPTQPTRNGYFFCGWYRITWAGGYNIVEYDFDTPVTEDIILTAVWKKIYNVKFINIDGEVYAIVAVVEGNVVEAPNVSLSGYTLKNWYNSDEAYDFTAPVMEDMTLTAEWELNPESTEPEVQEPSNEETPNEQENTETVKNENNNKTLALGIAGGSVAGLGAISAVAAIIIAKKRHK